MDQATFLKRLHDGKPIYLGQEPDEKPTKQDILCSHCGRPLAPVPTLGIIQSGTCGFCIERARVARK